MAIVQCRDWYDAAYRRDGGRNYPNEELLRFFGRRFFPIPPSQRRAIRILEAGCGTGGNLWMISREGFDAHGVDLAPAAVEICRARLAAWGLGDQATITVGNMTAIAYPDRSFDAIVDVFSAYCLPAAPFRLFLDEVGRLLRPGGRFFTYTPSKASDAWLNPGGARMIDGSTLEGIKRETSPFAGNAYPFRFVTPDELTDELAACAMRVDYAERVGRTYGHGGEYFEFVVIEAVKLPTR